MVKNHSENRPNDEKYSTKLSRTVFIMIAVSLGFWLPSTVIFSVHSFYAIDVSQYLLSTLLQYYTWPILSLILSYTVSVCRFLEKL